MEVLDAEPDAVADMDQDTQGQDGHHDFDDRGTHEIAAQLEPAVPMGVREVVRCHLAKLTMQGIQHREEVNGAMQKQEDDKECARDALDKLLADRRG